MFTGPVGPPHVKVLTEYWRKPGPGFDWDAWIDGHEELCTVSAATQRLALIELADDLEDLHGREDLAAAVRDHLAILDSAAPVLVRAG